VEMLLVDQSEVAIVMHGLNGVRVHALGGLAEALIIGNVGGDTSNGNAYISVFRRNARAFVLVNT
jgi:hypothetical protein